MARGCEDGSEGLLRFPVLLPQLQRPEAFGVGRGYRIQEPTSHPNRMDRCRIDGRHGSLLHFPRISDRT